MGDRDNQNLVFHVPKYDAEWESLHGAFLMHAIHVSEHAGIAGNADDCRVNGLRELLRRNIAAT